jgi:hypothetical protein
MCLPPMPEGKKLNSQELVAEMQRTFFFKQLYDTDKNLSGMREYKVTCRKSPNFTL